MLYVMRFESLRRQRATQSKLAIIGAATTTLRGGGSSDISTTTSPSSLSPTASTAVRPPSRSLFTEPELALPSSAPPAYTPSPTSPLTSSSQGHRRNYSTFSQNSSMGRIDEEHHAPLLGGVGHPQSMGGESQVVEEEAGLVPVWMGRTRSRASWLRPKYIVLAGLFFVLLCTIISSALSVAQAIGRFNRGGKSLPGQGDQNNGDTDKAILPQPSCWVPGEVRETRDFKVTFKQGHNLFVAQRFKESSGHQIKIGGDIVVRRLDGSGQPRVTLDMVANDAAILDDTGISWDESAQVLVVQVPRGLHWIKSDAEWPCFQVLITVWVPENGALDFLTLEAVHLGVKLFNDLSIQDIQSTAIEAVAGNIQSGYEPDNKAAAWRRDGDKGMDLNSRVIRVRTISGSIRGQWPLYDLLDLSSRSGDISASITPKPMDKSDPKPAFLRVDTISGDITAAENIPADRSEIAKAFPPRHYIATLRTTSGDIGAHLAFSTGCNLETVSGDVKGKLLPVVVAVEGNESSSCPTTDATALVVQTRSGDIDLAVLEPLHVSLEAIPARDGHQDLKDGIVYEPIYDDDPYKVITRLRESMSTKGSMVSEDTKDTASEPAPPSAPITSTTPTLTELPKDGNETTPFYCLRSSHQSISGDITLKYPQSWEGDMLLESLSGGLSVEGDGVEIVWRKGRSALSPRSMLARKGRPASSGASMAFVKSVSGDLKAIIGEKTK